MGVGKSWRFKDHTRETPILRLPRLRRRKVEPTRLIPTEHPQKVGRRLGRHEPLARPLLSRSSAEMVNLASTQSPKDLLEFLKGHRMFNKQDPATLTNLAGSLEVVSLDSGDFLFHENDLVDSVYIVADGHVFKVKEIDDNTDERNRKSLRMGSIVGCIGTSEQQDGVQVGYALRVSSLDDPATLIKIPRRSLHELMESEPSIKDLVKELEDSRWRTW